MDDVGQDDLTSRIGVLDCLELPLRDLPARIGHQRGMQRLLARTGLFERMHLRPQVVGAQKIVRNAQASGRVAL